MTRRQNNNQWSGDIAAHPTPKNSDCKNPLENSRLDFLGSRRHHPHCLSSKWPNYQRGELLISAGVTEGRFEGKKPWESHQVGLVLVRQCPGSSDTCNPEEVGLHGLPVSWSHTLFSGSGPIGLPPVPWTEKQLKGRHFSSDTEVIATAGTWLDGQPSIFFLSGFHKLEHRAKICIELRGNYVEYPEFGPCSLFPSWSG